MAMKNSLETNTLEHIRKALEAAVSVLASFVPGTVRVHGSDRGPVTEADLVANQVLRTLTARQLPGAVNADQVDEPDALLCAGITFLRSLHEHIGRLQVALRD